MTRENLLPIDAHFWDWMIWLASKVAKRDEPLVRQELTKLAFNLLFPLGATDIPASIRGAVGQYLLQRNLAKQRFGMQIDRRLSDEALRHLHHWHFA